MKKGNINLKVFLVQSAIIAVALLLLSFMTINGAKLISINGFFTAIVSAAIVGLINGLIPPVYSSLNLAENIGIKALMTLGVNTLLLLLMWALFRSNFAFGGFFRFLLALILISIVSLVVSYFVKSSE